MNGRKMVKRLLSLLLAVVMVMTLAPVSAKAEENSDMPSLDYRIVHLDCGRKYFSVDNIKSIIDTASVAGFNCVELAVGNDGLRFLLDDMSVTVGEASFESADVTVAVQAANKVYYDAGEKNELIRAEMDEIIDYANEKGMEIIPLLNSPGHMNAIVSAMATLGINGSYNGSENTIDITNADAVAFTKALIQKYIAYFSEKGCTVFNFGADEYANDIYATGGMGFGQLESTGQYGQFVNYVNDIAAMIKAAGMVPMAFNDGIYYNRNTSDPVDTDIMIAYWSSGWSGYNVASASFLADQGFRMINTNGDYYWVLGKDAQCSAEKAAGFDATAFMGNSTISDPAGAMFCIWCDYPGADTAENVVANTKDTITAFGGALIGETEGGNESGEGDGTDTAATVTDSATNISITANGLTGVTVSRTETDVTVEGAKELIAYEIVPTTDEGIYTGSAIVTIPVPETWTNVRGGVLASDSGEEVTGIEGTLSEGNFTFEVPHFSTAVVYDLEENSLQERTITVTAGSTATDTIEGVNLSGNTYNAEDPSVVSIEVTGNDGTPESTTYSVADVSYNDLIGNNSSSWQRTGYYYRPDDENYYPLYAQRSGSDYIISRYDYIWGYSTTDSSDDVVKCGSDNSVLFPGRGKPSITVYQVSGTTPETPATTTVTFAAAENAAEQTTYATVGDIHYTINVIAVDLSHVQPLTIGYWITNAYVNDENGNQSIDITAKQAYGENGVAISGLVPQKAVKSGDGYTTVYWKARRLPDGYWQYTAGENGVDRCTDEHGTDITHIRYWQETWWYSEDGEQWTRVSHDDQIVAYYMQQSTVTDEVTTVFVDYGVEKDGWSGASWLNGKYVRLDFAVRYHSGERVPDTFSTEKTLLYHCDGVGPYRTLKPIRALETAEYEVYLITLTPTSDDSSADFGNATTSTQNYFYEGTETVAWAATQEDLDNSGMDKWTSISGNYSCVIGGSPDLQAIEIYNLQGMRVTYYLRAKETKDSLTVHYIDRTVNDEFYNYNIAVKSGIVFDKEIALPDPWKGDLVNGTVYNSNNRPQTVSSDLATLTELSKAYADRNYTCVEVTRSEDGKDVYLYYEFNDTHTVVYDYGLPITVSANELGLQNADNVTANTGRYGKVTVNADNSVTYTPSTMSPQIENVTLTATFSDTGTEQKTTTILRVMPATTVYYEDDDPNFITFSDGWDTAGNTAGGTQSYNTTPYGYDTAYAGSGYYSNGSAHTVDIAEGGDSQTATFTFTGTGFDLYSQTGENNGLLSIRVVNDSGEMVKNTSVQNTGNNTLYQIPVYTVKNLTYDTYTVTVTAFAAYENTYYPSLSRGGYHVIDAVQIYNPLTAEGTQYQTDNEANAVRMKIRDAIIDAETYNSADGSGNGVLYINADSVEDEGGVIDYTLVGPNNEAYLNSTESKIGFILETSSQVASLQIGAKSADGKSVTMNVTVNGETNTATIDTATAMNYKLENLGTPGKDNDKNQYTVYISKTDGEGILSITDVKATFASSATAEFKYSKAVAEGAVAGTAAQTEAVIQENGVTVTTNRVRYGRTMTMEVVTTNALSEGQSFTVQAGSQTYSKSGRSLNALTVSDGKQNSDGTYTYTLQLKPYTYKLFGNTSFVISLTNSSGAEVVSTQTIAVRVTLL